MSQQPARRSVCLWERCRHARADASTGKCCTAPDLHWFHLVPWSEQILWPPKPLTLTYGHGFPPRRRGVRHPATDHTLVVLSSDYDSALPLIKAMEIQSRERLQAFGASLRALAAARNLSDIVDFDPYQAPARHPRRCCAAARSLAACMFETMDHSSQGTLTRLGHTTSMVAGGRTAVDCRG